MDDFLYNLRRETDKRNRRQGGGQQQYRGPDRRGGKDQRKGFTKRHDATAELLPEIKSILETISENQKQLVENDKRKTLALENIAASLRVMSGNNEPIEMPEAADTPSEPAAAVQPAEKTDAVAAETTSEEEPEAVEATVEEGDAEEAPVRSSREEIRKIALELRDQGKTYKEIAQHLDDEKIPTFSGKGGWHAPTIHKLCK
jgi:histone H3/H4